MGHRCPNPLLASRGAQTLLRGASDPISFGLRDQQSGVLWQQIPLGNKALGGLLHRSNVSFSRRIPLLNGKALVSDREPLGLGARKWDETALECAQPIFEEAVVEQVPPR